MQGVGAGNPVTVLRNRDKYYLGEYLKEVSKAQRGEKVKGQPKGGGKREIFSIHGRKARLARRIRRSAYSPERPCLYKGT